MSEEKTLRLALCHMEGKGDIWIMRLERIDETQTNMKKLDLNRCAGYDTTDKKAEVKLEIVSLQ